MNKSLFIFGGIMLFLAITQHYFVARCCHYVPEFDSIDGFFFGLAIIPLVVGAMRLFKVKK